MKKRIRAVTSLLISMSMFSSLCGEPLNVVSQNSENQENHIPVTLEVIDAKIPENKIDISVPTTLPIIMDTGGSVSVAENAELKNNGTTSVSVTAMTLKPETDWKLAPFTENTDQLPADQKVLGIKINECNSTKTGIEFDQNKFPEIKINQSMPIRYQVKIPRQTQLSEPHTIATVVFVVGCVKNEEEPNIVRYVTEEGKTNTIHWTKGIDAPTMPNQIYPVKTTVENSDFKLINGFRQIVTPETNQDVEEYYVTKYLPGHGWYDINKQLGQGIYDDQHFCFLASAGNMLQWWMDQNQTYIRKYLQENPTNEGLADLSGFEERFMIDPMLLGQDPNSVPMYVLLRSAYLDVNDRGGNPDYVTDFFLNGYAHKCNPDERNTPQKYQADKAGGFFYPVFGKSILSDRISNGRYDTLNQDFKKHLDAGVALSIAYSYQGPINAHAITVWGAEYDENDELTAIYITDSNDSGVKPEMEFDYYTERDGSKHLIGMIRYKIYKDPQGGSKITTLKNPNNNGSRVLQYYALTLAEEGWDYYFANHKPMYENGQAFMSPILPPDLSKTPNEGTPGCQHTFKFAKEGNKITKRCEHCSYLQWTELKPRMGADYTYYGKPVRPFGMFPSPGWNHSASLTYQNNEAPGTATVKMSYKGVVVSQDFEIKPYVEP